VRYPKSPSDQSILTTTYKQDWGTLEQQLQSPDTDCNIRGQYDETPLHALAAMQTNNIEAARALLKHGADATLTDCHGYTPAVLARCYGHHALAQLLDRHVSAQAKQER